MRMSTPISWMTSVIDRQHEVEQPACPVVADRDIAEDRQPAELQAEKQQQQQAEPEGRDRQQHGGRADQRQIGQAVLPPGGDDAGRNGNQARQKNGNHDDLGADCEARQHEMQDGLVSDDRPAEIA